MNKFYLTWSNGAPLHPSEVYGLSFETGLSWHGQINPDDVTLNDWKNIQVEKYNRLNKELKDKGKIHKLNWIINPTDIEIKNIEKDLNFIKLV